MPARPPATALELAELWWLTDLVAAEEPTPAPLTPTEAAPQAEECAAIPARRARRACRVERFLGPGARQQLELVVRFRLRRGGARPVPEPAEQRERYRVVRHELERRGHDLLGGREVPAVEQSFGLHDLGLQLLATAALRQLAPCALDQGSCGQAVGAFLHGPRGEQHGLLGLATGQALLGVEQQQTEGARPAVLWRPLARQGCHCAVCELKSEGAAPGSRSATLSPLRKPFSTTTKSWLEGPSTTSRATTLRPRST